MSQQTPAKAVSQFPLPPQQYYQSCATHRNPPPPAPGPNDSYNMFGGVYTTDDTLPSLEEAGRKKLYDPAAPPCQELRRMNKELLEMFMKLVQALCEPLPPDAAPQPHQEIVQSIEDTFVNMQHLINVMRPAQAAMDLKTILDRQTTARKDMAEKLKESVKRAWDLIGEAAEKLSEPSTQLSEQAKMPVGAPENFKEDMGVGEKDDGRTKQLEQDNDPAPSTAQILAQITRIVQDPTL